MPFDITQAIGFLTDLPRFPPTVKGWTRLEGRPRTVDFERALRAEVRDALWFLTRQWQFGEFRGEDAGSPVEIRTAVQCIPLQHYAVRGGPAVAYDRELPLEARVERESVPGDLITHVQISRSFFARMRALAPGQLATVRGLYRTAYPLAEDALVGAKDERTTQVLPLARNHVFDGITFLAEVASGAHDTRVDGFGIPNALKAQLTEAAAQTAGSFGHLYEQPRPGDAEAWAPSYLEYQFACAAEAQGVPQTVLTADQYASGHLDWYSFDIDARPDARLVREDGIEPELPPIESRPLSFLPVPVSFAGMPSHRYWEMENRRIEFADIDAQTTDIAKLILTEFTLVYGNDWCIIPYDVEVGSVCEVLGMLVTDTFGEKVLVRAAGRGIDDEWQRWTMFTLSTNQSDGRADTRLFFPPALPKLMESTPLEKVIFLRDEMANMAWAIERTVPLKSGAGGDGYAVARELAPPPALPALHPTSAPVRYILGTDVPPNWRPFIPVHVPGSNRRIQLQRARMPRSSELLGQILDVPTPYYIHEEEVPRAGRIAMRSVQRARWLDGRIFTWIGRRVLTGRGEGSSGLVFDQVQPVKKEE